MKAPLRLALASIVFSAALLGPAAAASEPGYVDFGKLVGPEKGEFVEITLGKGLLKLAGVVVKKGNPDAAELIAGLSRVRVNVVGLDDSNRAETTKRVQGVREQLARAGWEQIVNARGKKQEDVVVYVKQREGEVIEGIVVTVIDERKKEAVFVNVVGHIKPEQLSSLGEHLHIDPLRTTIKAEKS